MKKLAIIAATAAFGIFALLNLIHSLATDDPIGYFSQNPSRLLLVAGIAITGGLITWGFYMLPSRAQQRARVLSLIAAASAATAACGYFVYAYCSLASIAAKHGGSFWSPLPMFLPVLVMLLVVAALCWIASWRICRQGAKR